jgi:hypothetical protein
LLKNYVMSQELQIILSLITAVGIGGILGAYFKTQFERKKELQEQEHQLKRTRYGVILMLMLAKLDPKDGLEKIKPHRADLKSITDIDKELKAEYYNAIIFASDNVLKTMTGFIKSPTYQNYITSATAIRKDLWKKKTRINENDIVYFN